MTLKTVRHGFDLTMIIVSFVIGMGIFRTPANVAAVSATPLILSVLDCGRHCSALRRHDLRRNWLQSTHYRRLLYHFAYAYHPSIAFAINCIILIKVMQPSMAAVSLVGSEYIVGVLLPASKTLLILQFPPMLQVKAMQVTVAIVSIIMFMASICWGWEQFAALKMF